LEDTAIDLPQARFWTTSGLPTITPAMDVSRNEDLAWVATTFFFIHAKVSSKLSGGKYAR